MHVKTLKKINNTSFSPALKAVQKMAIFFIFENFELLQNQNFKPPIDFDRVLNLLFIFIFEFSTRP